MGPGSVFADRGGTAIGQVVQQRQGVTGKPVRLADSPPFLAGREDLLAELGTRLTGGDGSGPRTVALRGLGGAGKTSVAVEYAHRHLAEVGVAWQLAAEDPTVLAAGFGELAAQLGARDVLDTRDPVASVHGVLAAFPAEWLLIFDNAPDRASVQAFIPPAGPGRVLLTSQNQHWPPRQAIDVSVLATEVAADFLVNRTGDPDQQAAVDLAGELGGLPLALEQAAAYVQATGDSLAGYLALFGERRAAMLDRGEPTGYGKTVATTWALAFVRLEQATPAAAALLRLLAFCAPEAIPLRLLLRPRPGLTEGLHPQVIAVLMPLLEDPLVAKDAIAALRRYSLISPAPSGTVSVHRLVQAVTGDQMPAELVGAWQQAAAAVIEAAIPDDPERPDTWPDFAVLLPHAQAALTWDSDGRRRIAAYFGFSGSYVAAREFFRGVVDTLVRVLGPEHLNTLTARSILASSTGQAGDVAGARDQSAALLPVMERILGPEHPVTLTTRANLAYWTGEGGDPAGARDQSAALLSVMERILGPEHPGTLTARGNLARWTGQAGDAAGARDQYAALLPVREQVSGPRHPETLTLRGNLAYWTGQAGDLAGARDQSATLLPVREQVSGPEHPETLIDRSNLARWSGEAGDPAGARDEYAALLPVRERVSGPHHPATLSDRGNLAYWTAQAGDPAGARDQYAALLPTLERVSGPEHPETLMARSNLARWSGEAGDPAGARDQYAALLPVRERVSGPHHPATLVDRGNLAFWTGEAGDPAGARDQYAALLPTLERVSGPEHPETLTARTNLARWTGLAGDTAGARDQYAALLPVRERVSGPHHPATLGTRANLAYWTGEAGDPAGARDQYAALLTLAQVSAPGHPTTLSICANLAYWTGLAGDAAGARDVCAALLPVMERILGPEHPDTWVVRKNLASWTEKARRRGVK